MYNSKNAKGDIQKCQTKGGFNFNIYLKANDMFYIKMLFTIFLTSFLFDQQKFEFIMNHQ